MHEPLSRNRAEFESDRKVPLPMTAALRTFTDGDSRAAAEMQRRSGMPVQLSGGSGMLTASNAD